METNDQRKYYSIYFYDPTKYYAGSYGVTNEATLKIVEGQYKNIFGKTKNKYSNYCCRFYAIEDGNDYYDPITREKITDYVGGGPYYYVYEKEIKEDDNDELKNMAEQIEEINSNEKLKQAYIATLKYFSSLTCRVLKREYAKEQKKLELERQQEEENQKTFKFLQSYNIHKK